MLPLDLHVLSLPPAFNLSHDQTLQLKIVCANIPLKKHSLLNEFCRDILLPNKRKADIALHISITYFLSLR